MSYQNIKELNSINKKTTKRFKLVIEKTSQKEKQDMAIPEIKGWGKNVLFLKC